MTHLLLGFVGVLLLARVLQDILWTTFLEGAGPVTRHLCSWISRAMLVLHCRFPRSRRIITKTGLLTVMATTIAWALMLWIGWALIFSADSHSIVPTDPTADQPSFWTRLYYTGCEITTLGTADYRANGKLWELLTVLAGGSGFFLIGVAIAYVVPVVTATTQKRQLAQNIWSLGKNPADIITRAWNGVDTTALGPHLVSLSSMLALLGESHQTYPILHYFHSSKRSSAIAPSVAALDEALTILECGLQSGCSLDVPALGAARESITEYLATLKPALVTTTTADPPEPSLAMLRDMGVPAVDDDLFKAALRPLAERRRLLLTLVRNEGWTWEAVWPKSNLPRVPDHA